MAYEGIPGTGSCLGLWLSIPHLQAPANCKKQHTAGSLAADPNGSPDLQPDRGGKLHAELLGSKQCH